jgi:hypothetical protein
MRTRVAATPGSPAFTEVFRQPMAGTDKTARNKPHQGGVMSDLWTWREYVVVLTPGDTAQSAITGTDVTGFDVDATDGHVGKVDKATYEVGGSYLIVDTGFWIFGKKRMIPASMVDNVDPQERKVYLRISKDDVKKAPDYDADRVWGDQRATNDEYYNMTTGRRQ